MQAVLVLTSGAGRLPALGRPATLLASGEAHVGAFGLSFCGGALVAIISLKRTKATRQSRDPLDTESTRVSTSLNATQDPARVRIP